jgi:hypothetical protein
MRRGRSSLYDETVALTLAERTANTNSNFYLLEGARGLLVVVHVAAVTTGTARLVVSGVEPFGGNAFGINAATPTFNAAGQFVYVFTPGCAKRPSGESGDTSHANVVAHVGIPVPHRFFLTLVKSDASAWTYGVSMRRIPRRGRR